MRELAEKMIENAQNCEANPCYGVSSPVAFYCSCFRNAMDNCEDFSKCICAQIPSDQACRNRAVKACRITKEVLDIYNKAKKCCPKKGRK